MEEGERAPVRCWCAARRGFVLRRRRDIGGSHPLLDSPYNMSVADLASQLAALLLEGFPTRRSKGLFRQLDDSLEIDFAVEGEDVIMSTGGRTLTVGRAAFVEGVTSFILEFAREAQRRVPAALKWKDLTAVQEFLATAVA